MANVTVQAPKLHATSSPTIDYKAMFEAAEQKRLLAEQKVAELEASKASKGPRVLWTETGKAAIMYLPAEQPCMAKWAVAWYAIADMLPQVISLLESKGITREAAKVEHEQYKLTAEYAAKVAAGKAKAKAQRA